MDHRLCPCRERGRDLRRLSESHAVCTPPAPADLHGHLISDADTTHHRLLPGVFCLQKMALQTRWSLPPLHKEVRASWTLTKVLGGVTCQGSEGVDHPPFPAVSKGSVGLGGLWGSRVRSRSSARSITSHRSQWSGSAQSQATDDGQETSSESEPSHEEEDVPCEDEDAEVGKGDAEVLSDSQAASNGDEGQGCAQIQNTLTGVSHIFGTHEETDKGSDTKEKIQSARPKWRQPSPKEDTPSKASSESSSEKEQPTDEALCNKAWQWAQQLDTNFDAWWRKKIAKGIGGWAVRDTMICDLPEHGKAQPNHLDPVGPPLDYMDKCQVFDGIWSDIYDLCRFYILGMTGDPPEFPASQEPATHGQIRDLLKSALAIGWPYLILVHSADSVTAISMLRELHSATCLWRLQVDLWDKSVKLSFCPFCAYAGEGGNDLSYLNHIVIAHYNTSYGCGKCLKQAFISSSALHTHKKVCLGLASKKATGVPDSKPSSGRGDSPFCLSALTTLKQVGNLPPPQSPTRRTRVRRERRQTTRAWPAKALDTRRAKMVAAASLTPRRRLQAHVSFQ